MAIEHANMIKKLARAFPLVLLWLGAGCLERQLRPQADVAGPIYRHHFVGRTEMAQTTNAANLKTVLSLPASKELRNQLVQKLAEAPREFWKKEIPATSPSGAELLRPLVEDLLSSESYLEVRGPAERPESVLAVKLNGPRAGLWHTNLWKLLSIWKLGAPTDLAGADLQGWEWKDKSSPRLVRFVRRGEWVLVGLGEERLAALASFIEKGGQAGRPVPLLTNSWFELEMDWPRLKQFFPLMAKYSLPPTQLTITPQGEYLRTEARLRYAEPIPWKYEPWKIPTNSISEPIISFTIARGIAPLLSRSATVRDLGLKDLPNQFCLWGQSYNLAVTFLSVPVASATNLADQLARSVPKVVRAYLTNHLGSFVWVSNKSEILWQGLPFILPRLHPVSDGGLEYLVAEILPMQPKKTSPPAELFHQFMGRTNLVYYDWEITSDRLPHAKQLHQLYNIINGWQVPGTNVPTQNWLLVVGPHLGNTVTEVTVASPKELHLVRKSHLGFTGFELASLARWIESPAFPLRYEPPLPPRPTNSAVKATSSPPKKL